MERFAFCQLKQNGLISPTVQFKWKKERKRNLVEKISPFPPKS